MKRIHWRARGFTLLELMIVIAIIAILAAILVPNWTRSRSQSKLASCKENLCSIAAALESYATDHSGVYPDSITYLTNGSMPFLRHLPSCPECGDDSSYIAGYEHATSPNRYTIVCKGHYHSNCLLEPNFPGYAPTIGLFEKVEQINGEAAGATE